MVTIIGPCRVVLGLGIFYTAIHPRIVYRNALFIIFRIDMSNIIVTNSLGRTLY